MRQRRILLVHEPGLLAEGLKNLLEEDGRLEVISTWGDPERLEALVRELCPDVLLIEEDKFPLSLGDPPGTVRLERVPLVIAVSNNENRMRVYRVQEQALTTLAELVEALTGRLEKE